MAFEYFRWRLLLVLREAQRRPLVAVACVATTALLVIATTTVARGAELFLLSMPRGIERPESVKRIYATTDLPGRPKTPRNTFSYLEFAAVKEAAAAYGEVTYYTRPERRQLKCGNTVVDVTVGIAGEGLTDLLAVQTVGRASAQTAAGQQAALAARGAPFLATRGSACSSAGLMEVAGRPYEVRQTLPRDFGGFHYRRVDVWLPPSAAPSLGASEDWRTRRQAYGLSLLIRVRRTANEVAMVNAITMALRAEAGSDVSSDPRITAHTRDLALFQTPEVWGRQRVLGTVAVTAALLVALGLCNLAALMAMRAAARRPVIALQIAMGSGRRELLADALSVVAAWSLVGSVIGVSVAWSLWPLVSRVVLGARDSIETPGGWQAAVGSVGFAFATGLLASLAPLVGTFRSATTGGWRDAGLAMGPRRGRTDGVVLAVFALFVTALVCVGADFAGAWLKLNRQSVGLQPHGLYVVDLKQNNDAAAVSDLTPLLRKLERSEGGRRAAQVTWSTAAPGVRQAYSQVRVVGPDRPAEGTTGLAAITRADTSFARILRWTVTAGRSPWDEGGVRSGALINEAFAGRLGGRDRALRNCIVISTMDDANCISIVGVVANVQLAREGDSQADEVYVRLAPTDQMAGSCCILVRAPNSETDLARTLAAEAMATYGRPDVVRVTSIETVVREARAPITAAMTLSAGAAAGALVLAALGVWALSMFRALNRRRGNALRLVFGASRLSLAFREFLVVAIVSAVGALIGVVMLRTLGQAGISQIADVPHSGARDLMIGVAVAAALGSTAAGAIALSVRAGPAAIRG